MIDPEKFINKTKKQPPKEENLISITGTFICQENNCNELVRDAKLNELKNRIIWICSNGHTSEAKL